MNLEQRLNLAAAETNQVARNTVPRGFGSEHAPMRPWLAFAAAFAVVIAVVGIPWALANLGQSTPPSQPVAVPDTSSTTLDDTVTTLAPTTSAPAPECATSDLYPPTTIAYSDDSSDPRDTTEPVRDKLGLIAQAAQSCDQATLADLAAPDFTTLFGAGDGVDDLVGMHEDGVPVYQIIGDLFNMSHGVVDMEDGERLFVWPAAFAYDSWDEIPDQALAELTLLYTDEEIEQLELLGVYGGWRTGITESGDWIFFTAGD